MSDTYETEPVADDVPAAETGAAPSGATGRSRRRIAPWIALAVAVVVAALFVVLAQADGGDAESAATPLMGKVAPAVSGTTIDGEPWELSRRKGSWVVLNFFQSTCVPCKEEHPELVRFAEQQRSLDRDGAELYTIVYSDDDVGSVRKFFADNGGDWPVVLDPRGSIGVEFQVNKVPETWIISPEGVVVYRTIQKVEADSLSALMQQLREARDAAVSGG
jgi:cytochrome c biogenesis protein CcmG/thiol:disulfide interchange protein DsbE